MHERTQRMTARLLFVFCCAVPTCFTCLCILMTWTPWYHHRALQRLEAKLSLTTGLAIEIEEFEKAAPSIYRLHGVTIREPETTHEIARIREIEHVTEDGEVTILLQQPEIQAAELKAVWQLLHQRFLCRPDLTAIPVRASANDLTLHSRTGSLTLKDMDAWIVPNEDAVEATLACLPANSLYDTPINIMVRRDRGGTRPATRWSIDTRGTALPCSAIADFLPEMEKLGVNAEFSGTMTWQIDKNHWWIDLGGSRFTDVALDQIFERNSHRLSGTATFEFDRCRIDPHSKRSDISGSMIAKNGQMGRSLLIAANQNCGFEIRLQDRLVDQYGDIPFDLLGLGFNVNNAQINLTGTCRNEVGYEGFPANVALCLDGFPIVFSTPQTLDSLSVLNVVAPNYSVAVPMSDQTDWLMNILIPPSRPMPSNQPRIRSANNWHGGPTISQPQ